MAAKIEQFPHLRKAKTFSRKDSHVETVCQSSTDYLKSITCYDILPINSKLIYLDDKLLVKKALHALLQNAVRSAPVWDQKNNKLVGLLTATDFLNLMLYFYRTKENYFEVQEEMNVLSLAEVRERNLIPTSSRLLSVHPSASIYEAAKMLLDFKIHRVLLIDPESPVIPHKPRVKCLANDHISYDTISHSQLYGHEQLNLGSYNNIKTITLKTKIIDAVNIFIENELSCIPVVDENGILIDIYEKYDMMVMARGDSETSLDETITEALQSRSEIFEGVHTCRPTDTLESIMNTFRQETVHRFMIIDENKRLQGVLSLSDLLMFFIN